MSLTSVAFLLSAALVWIPDKAPAYILPLAILCLMVIARQSGMAAIRLLAVGLGFTALTVGWMLSDSGFYLLGALLTFVCYGGIIFYVVLGHKDIGVSDRSLQTVAKYWAWILVLEGGIGIGEAIYGYSHDHSFDIANGDWVKGSIGFTLHGLSQGGHFSNAMFAANIAFGLLMVATLRGHRKLQYWAFVIGICALILASVMHIILFLMAAIVLSVLVLQYGGGGTLKNALNVGW